MCDFINSVLITGILSEPITQKQQQEMWIVISYDGKPVKLHLIKSGQTVTAYYGTDCSLCEVIDCPDLASLKVGDIIKLGPSVLESQKTL